VLPGRGSFISASLAGLLILASSAKLHAQALVNLLTPQAIPRLCERGLPCEMGRPFKSWSLFLVCNPGWVLANGDKGFNELFRQFTAFGHAIGPDNLAVWFSHTEGDSATTENTDVSRMSTYCMKFGLLPSETPQVVITTNHPDDADVGAKIIANLSGDARNSAHVLTDLTDELLKTGLNQPSLNRNDWVRGVAAAVSTVMGSVACYVNKVSISIKTGVFNAEFAHTADRNC
jgi:hypothetical protein